METYSFLRELADSWALLALFVFFLAVVVWTIRPGSRALHREIADIPFRNEEMPGTQPCANACPDCTCKDMIAKFKEQS